MKVNQVIEEIKRNPFKVFALKRNSNIKLQAVDGAIDMSPTTYAFPNEEWEEILTKERLLKIAKPILFNTEMIQAILENRKTVTRRKIKLDLGLADTDKNDSSYLMIPDTDGDYHHAKDYCRYQVGDYLYVRETFRYVSIGDVTYEGECIWQEDVVQFKASEDEFDKEYGDYIGEYDVWRPSIHMPKSLARIFLKVTNVRVERVKDITNKEAKREGITVETDNSGLMYKANFVKLWNEIYGDWKDNPFVYVIEFERVIPK